LQKKRAHPYRNAIRDAGTIDLTQSTPRLSNRDSASPGDSMAGFLHVRSIGARLHISISRIGATAIGKSLHGPTALAIAAGWASRQ
jgi:hypothetical protein